ncbi:DUF4397 domain-containing protein [Halorarum salinum]|uniref:DUF4397 domain-containing protein n=1 Tax=Halorarum salinum TaxID=2743089 RepID=A0A7D5QN33_9EURY|nr:DUF4397 domain-containing protein [Halobaculum salinum]QLG63885.1 DUF4397 domain-containing protein [Halobaculum salinum]
MPSDSRRSTRTAVGLLLVALLVTSVAAAGVALAASTAAAQTDGDGNATVRAVHASPGAPAIDVAIDGETVLEGVSYGTVSEYLNVSQGNHSVTVTLSDVGVVVYEDEIDVESGRTYTVAAAGEVTDDLAASVDPTVLVDDASEPADDEAAVRLVHLSPDAPAVDVTVQGTGDVVGENVTYGGASAYTTVPAGDYTLEVRRATASNDGEVLATFDVTVEGGTAYTGFAVGYVDEGNATADAPFDLLVATDRTADSGTGTSDD